MDKKLLIQKLGFTPKEYAVDVYSKEYASGYFIEIDIDKQTFYFGGKIKIQGKDFQNITKPEDWVVLECVNRLLERGFNPENISLEKVYPSGHGTSGRLDICVTREDGSEYLLIECKTFGKEFDKEFTRIKKDGGQLFTYFKFSNKADLIMLYASQLSSNEIIYKNEIIKIENEYRVGDVKDFHNAWNKITKKQGVWENSPYDFKSKIFTKKDLVELSEVESKKIFHEFASILRKHSVSDKPNAFNKIFNLFLAKLYDEAKRENDELEFRWRENDNAVDFQVRLINLHKDGLFAFLQKEIEGIDEKDFKANSPEELLEKKKKVLKFNNILAIKEVLDDPSFEENQRVLKDVVQLLEKYQIRYPRKQQHLSDFFEKLLTTGLKQEVGQYFTPPPITKFIVRSLPIKQMIEKEVNKEAPVLPAIIDYAAGSGHFITEAMEEYQDIINAFTENEINNFYPKAIKQIKSWRADPYEWAAKYVYGIEKDYRLVKVAKVGCYFYGDGVAQIIHGDGLDSFETSKTYKGLLKENTNLDDSTKAKFSLVLSNPPYSVNDCKDDLEYIGAQNDFTLYSYLSEKSKDIECLFVERTKHLLKDDGIAAIVLPSSILNNTGIQTKTREIILQYFDIVAIAELGGNTFMATNTNTVTLFLKRRNNNESVKLKNYVNKFCVEFIDNTINHIEKPISKYVSHVWDSISFEDYISLLKQEPTKAIEVHEIYKEYRKKIKTKKESEFWDKLIETEKDKLLHFIIACNQKNIVLVKSGEKDAEKRFIGYYFSDRRGSEGMHPIQGGKSIDECTQLYDTSNKSDFTKASSYIYNAFVGNHNLEISENLKDNVSYIDLLDMLTFDRAEFHKELKLSVKKKVKIESRWDILKLNQLVSLVRGASPRPIKAYLTDEKNGVNWIKIGDVKPDSKFITETKEKITIEGADKSRYVKKGDFILSNSMSFGRPYIMGIDGCIHDGWLLLSDFSTNLNKDYLYYILSDKTVQAQFISAASGGTSVDNLNIEKVSHTQIPLPPLDIQQKIVAEIEVLEVKEKQSRDTISELNEGVSFIIGNIKGEHKKLRDLCKYSETRIKSDLLTSKNYIGVDNMLQNTAGKIDSNFVPDSGTSTEYKTGNILLSNIRPYLKKIWFADNNGGSSGDVLVLQNIDKNVVSKYIYYHLKQDNFFDYEMQGIKGIKMPRGDKQHIMNYKIPLPPLSVQQKIVSEIEQIEEQLNLLEKELSEIPKQKEEILNKYLA